MKQLYLDSAKNIVGYNNGVDIMKIYETPNGTMLDDILINKPFTSGFGWDHEPKVDAMRVEVAITTWNVNREVKINLKECLDKSK